VICCGCPLLAFRELRDYRSPAQSAKPVGIKRFARAMQDATFQLLKFLQASQGFHMVHATSESWIESLF
jgi:hypothetical protein